MTNSSVWMNKKQPHHATTPRWHRRSVVALVASLRSAVVELRKNRAMMAGILP
jgi:hypothetical protein